MISSRESRDWTEIPKPYSWRKVRPRIRQDHCILCGVCKSECPFKAIDFEKNKYIIRYDLCRGCGICALDCLVRAIYMSLPQESYEGDSFRRVK